MRGYEPKLNHTQLQNDLQEMSNLSTQQTIIPLLQNPPLSPNFSGNAVNNNMAMDGGTAVNPGLGSRSGGINVPLRGGGGRGGGPGGPFNSSGQINRPMMVYPAPVISGGIDNFNHPWVRGGH